MRASHPKGDLELMQALSDDALSAIEWLQKYADAKFIRIPTDALYDHVLAPPAVARIGQQWKGRGADVLLRTLERNLKLLGGSVLRGWRATKLSMDNNHYSAVIGETFNGLPFKVSCADIVIADGGFHGNDEYLKQYVCPMPSRLVHRNARTAKGDGLKMAMEVGAAMALDAGFYGHVQSVSAIDNDKLWPYPWLDEVTRASIVVNKDGKRFADEGQGGIFLANKIAQLSDPASSTLIFDAVGWSGPAAARPTGPNPKLLNAGGKIFKADSLHELSLMAEIDPLGLTSEVAMYNQAVIKGKAGDLNPVRTTKNFKPLQIHTPPFYAIPLAAGITYAFGGIKVDAFTRVLDLDNIFIPGLYAVGSASGGLEGGENFSYFGGLTKAAVTGLRAADIIHKNLRS